MPKNKHNKRVAVDVADTSNWGDVKDYVDKVDCIPESKAVREGSAFMNGLGIHTCTVQ